jgi:hypothetical protein
MAGLRQGIAGRLECAQTGRQLTCLIQPPPEGLCKGCPFQGIFCSAKGLFGHRGGRGHAPFLFIELRQPGPRGLRQRGRSPLDHRAIEAFGAPWIAKEKGEIAQRHAQALAFFAAYTQNVIGERQGQLQRPEGVCRGTVIKQRLGFKLEEGQLIEERLIVSACLLKRRDRHGGRRSAKGIEQRLLPRLQRVRGELLPESGGKGGAGIAQTPFLISAGFTMALSQLKQGEMVGVAAEQFGEAGIPALLPIL